MNTEQAPFAYDPKVLGDFVPVEPDKGYLQTESGLLLSPEFLEQQTPFKVGELVPFKGWLWRITDIGAGSITLTVCGRTGAAKYKAASKKGQTKQRTNRKKKRRKR